MDNRTGVEVTRSTNPSFVHIHPLRRTNPQVSFTLSWFSARTLRSFAFSFIPFSLSYADVIYFYSIPHTGLPLERLFGLIDRFPPFALRSFSFSSSPLLRGKLKVKLSPLQANGISISVVWTFQKNIFAELRNLAKKGDGCAVREIKSEGLSLPMLDRYQIRGKHTDGES